MSDIHNFKSRLDGRAKTPGALFHKFRLAAAGSQKFHILFEGYEDLEFYSHTMDSMQTEIGDWVSHVTFGKKNMDQMVTLFRASSITDRRVLFIRDSDFDAFLGRHPKDDSVFLTCGYAVENYVCTKEAVERFLQNILGVDPSEIDVSAYGSRFAESVDAAFAWLTPLISAAIAAVREGRQLDLDKIDIRSAYSKFITTGNFPASQKAEELANAGLVEADFSSENLTSAAAFTAQNAIRWVRGKYLLEMASVFLETIGGELLALHRAGEINRFHRRANTNYQPHLLFGRLGRNAQQPAALRRAAQKIAA